MRPLSPTYVKRWRANGQRNVVLLLAFALVLMTINFISLTIPDEPLSPVHLYKTLIATETPAQFATSLSHASHKTTAPRGIVLPLYDDIGALGTSLIAELRNMEVDLPIEVPHCGDLSPSMEQAIKQNFQHVRIYNACQQAAKATGAKNEYLKLFCWNVRHCQQKFQSFDIKVLAVVLSQFDEVMLLDADTLFFQNPMQLWETDKYTSTGTLFFHDRISSDTLYLSQRLRSQSNVSMLHDFLSNFDVAPFRHLKFLPRAKATTPFSTASELATLPFEPSDFLLTSNVWNLRSGHEMDSSLVLWNKRKQPRATAILASFIALNSERERPNSYGDKEFFFLACELAETAYAFSDFSVGAIGWDLRQSEKAIDTGDSQSVLCGDSVHYFPTKTSTDHTMEIDADLLYMNSDNILKWGEEQETQLYRTKPRSATFYPGSFADRNLPATCPFDVTAIDLTTDQRERLQQRLSLFRQAVRQQAQHVGNDTLLW